MKLIEITLVGLIVLATVYYLCRMLFLKKKGNHCGCGTSGCKVPKPVSINEKTKNS